RALMDELGDDALQTAGVLPAPRSFAQLTAVRLAALDGDTQALVSAGAVLGSSFPLDPAATVGDVADSVPAFEAAQAAGLLELSADGDIRFPHLLLRGAVYNDLAPAHRRALHQAAAAATTGARSLEHRAAAAAGHDDELADELEGVASGELA